MSDLSTRIIGAVIRYGIDSPSLDHELDRIVAEEAREYAALDAARDPTAAGIYATDPAMERGLRGSPPLDPTAAGEETFLPALDDIVKAARKYHDHRTSIQPYDKTAPPQHYAADGCIKTFDREMKAAALADAQQREGAGE